MREKQLSRLARRIKAYVIILERLASKFHDQSTYSMGRTRTKKKAKATESSSKNPPSVQALLEKAESLIEQCDYDLALRFIKRILDQEPKNVVAREMLGVALLETGDLVEAKEASKISSSKMSGIVPQRLISH